MPWDWDKLQKQMKNTPGKGQITPPEMEDVFKKFSDFKGKFSGKTPMIIIAILLILFASSSFFTVAVDEVGVVQRFGKYVRTVQPGLNFKLPAGIEKVTKVRVKHVFKEEFGLRTLQAGIVTRYAQGSVYANEALMLTGDLNVAIVPWIVQFRVNDPFKFLFKVRNVRKTLRDLSESSMRLVVGDRSINEVITKREEIATEAQSILQKELNRADAGIKIVTVEMKKTNVPEPVQPSFNEVNQAIQEREKMIYQAKEQYNKAIPAAKGNAQKVIRTAEGYALARVNRAKGDAARFISVYNAYSKAREVTLKRIYLEAMQDIIPKIGSKYIIDAEQKNLLPLLNLGRLKGGKK